MRRTAQFQGLRLMKFDLRPDPGRDPEPGGRGGDPGISERTFRRWRGRFEADGADGLYDRRLGKVSARRAAVDEVMTVLQLFDTRYWDFGVKHLHETLVAEHGLRRSYNLLRITLQAPGRVRPASRRGAHRRKRPRRPMVGMMLHQDGSRHEWIAAETWDLIVTMDDASSDIYSAFFVAEEGTMSTFRGLQAVIAERGLFCSLYADRGSHYWHTPEARRPGRQGQPDPGRPRVGAARHRAAPGLFAGGARPCGTDVRHPAAAPAAGTARCRDRRHRGRQPLPRRCLSATPQRLFRPQGVTVQTLVEQAIVEFLANHPD